MVIVGEELGRKSYDIAVGYGLTVFGGQNLLKHGTEEQKSFFIPKVINGEMYISVSITESDAGSDVAGMKMSAKPDGDYFIINGQKAFSTAVQAKNNVITLYCLTDPGVSPRKGMSAFLVDNTTPAIEMWKLRTIGRWTLGINKVFFTDMCVHRSRLLGKLNGGWQVLLSGLEYERIFTAVVYVGNAQTMADEALVYALQREQFGREIGNFQVITYMLADMQTEVDAARLLFYRASWLHFKGKPCLKEVSMAKLVGSEVFVKVANQGMQILGGYGYIMEYNIQRYFRDSRICIISAGTSQIQRNIIARQMGLRP